MKLTEMFRKIQIQMIQDRLVFGSKPDIAESMNRMENYVKYLKLQQSFDEDQVRKIIVALENLSGDRSNRQTICSKLLQLDFIAVFEKVVECFKQKQHEQIQRGHMGLSHNYLSCLSILFNLSNDRQFARASVDSSFIKCVTSNLTSKTILENRKYPIGRLLSISIGFLNNVIQNAPDGRTVFHENNICNIALSFLNDRDITIRLAAIFILGYIIDENEAAKLEDNDCIAFLIQLIGKALSTSDHRYSEGQIAYTAQELLHGLSRIAINDVNKQKIMNEGGLEILMKAMRSENENERIGAVGTVYFLSFKPTKAQVKENKELHNILKHLATSPNQDINRAAKGALFQLNQSDEENVACKEIADCKHLFISYSWADKSIIWPLSERLKKHGFRLWIDTDDMKGSTLEAMSEAVENAWAVIMCLSEYYRESPDCRTEAEYTYKLRKPIVPIVLQRSYSPKGWLGALLGNRLYVDFKKWDMETAFEKLVKQISAHDPENGTNNVSESLGNVPSAKESNTFEGMRSYQADTWNKERVQEWIFENNLQTKLNDKLQNFLRKMDGEDLVGICYIEKKAPEYFTKMLTKQYDANMIEVAYLIRALHKLP